MEYYLAIKNKIMVFKMAGARDHHIQLNTTVSVRQKVHVFFHMQTLDLKT
jgi:hypothetical protein